MTFTFEKCWIKDCRGKPVGGQGNLGICKKHYDEARAEGRDPFLPPPRKKEKLRRVSKGFPTWGGDDAAPNETVFIADDGSGSEYGIETGGKSDLLNAGFTPDQIRPLIDRRAPRELERFSRDFRRSVPAVIKGEPCEWKRHFSGALREIIGDLEGTINRGAEAARLKRFAFKRIKTLVAGSVKKMHKDEAGKRIVDERFKKPTYKKGLAFLNDLGIIKRAELYGKLGWVVAPHALCCRVTDTASGIKECRFWVGALKGLPEPLKEWDWHGRECPCEICAEVYRQKP